MKSHGKFFFKNQKKFKSFFNYYPIQRKSYFGDACTWRNALTTQMSKLTPNGQQVMNQILMDLQNYMGAAIQPHFDTLTVKFGDKMTAVNATADAANLKVVGGYLGWRAGITRGLGQIQNSCDRQTGIRAAVNAMTPENQAVMKEALADVSAGMMAIYRPVSSIIMLKDKYLFDYLLATEDRTVLANIKTLFGR